MAKHEIVIHENTGAIQENASYTGTYNHKETTHIEDITEYLAKNSGLPEPQARAIFEGSFEVIASLEKTALVRIHTDAGVICGKITGSFETADAPFDEDKNALELAFYLADDVKLALVNEVPVILSDAGLTKLRVDNLADIETKKPLNLIHGQKGFRVSGFNMVLDDEGAGVFLEDRHGVRTEVIVDEVESKQFFKAHSAMLLESGDYKLVVKSRAGDPEGPLQVRSKNVKYLRVLPPEPVMTGVQCGENDPNVVWFEDGKLTITGEHLDGVTQAKLEAEFGSQTVTCDITNDIETITETKIETIADGFENNSPKPDMQWSDKQAKLVLVKGEVRGEYAVRFKAQA